MDARSHLIECLNSLLVVKSFQREDFAERGAAALLEDHRAACMRRNRFSNLCNVGFGLAMRAAYLVAAAYCAYGILEGSVSYESTLPLSLLWRRRELPLGDYSPIRKNLKKGCVFYQPEGGSRQGALQTGANAGGFHRRSGSLV